ncbi:hypothetical protein SDC9_114243 [bioreactor metagenome]|uniref:Uncharacterized protein n=1 Tax=bioreactor metagenome TaxID=1076179 RepID=A0A645BRT1_9ZZZZ
MEHSRLRLFQGAYRFADLSHGELVPRFQRQPVRFAAGILHVCSGAHGIACDPFHNGAQLFSEQLRALRQYGIIACEVEQIAHLNVCAILLHLRLNLALRKALARGSHALFEGERIDIRCKEFVAAEFHAFTAVSRYAAFLAIAGVDEPSLCNLKQSAVVKGFVAVGGACGVNRRVAVAHLSSSCVLESGLTAIAGGPFHLLHQLTKALAAHAAIIRCGGRRASAARALGQCASLADTRAHALHRVVFRLLGALFRRIDANARRRAIFTH